MTDWQTVPMGELCSIQSGKSDTKDAVADGPYAFFDRSKSIKRSSRFLRDCEALIIPGEGTEFLPRHFVGKFDLHQRAYALSDFSPRIEVRFLYHYLHHVADYFPSVAVGATVKSLRLRHFEQLPVRLTDPASQRRIVAILDETFEGIATAKANAEKSLRNARAVFESHLQDAYTVRVGHLPRERLECLCEKHRLITYGVIKLGDPHYCVRVTADDGAIGEQFLRDFQDNEKTIPTILTTSQKLSTGVDARNVRNIVLMRPVNSMIEFKQIIGRGTRLYDGKDYFTIYDFVKAHHHFADPEWDGEPQEPEPPRGPREPKPGEPDPQEPGPVPEPEPPRLKTMVKLADGKARTIQSMSATTFWSADGRPMSAAQFLETLFGTLPEFFKDEDELRRLWGDPETRKKLLHDLADRGFGKEPLSEMQKIIDAEKSDLFDMLAYVAFASAPLSREARADAARKASAAELTDKQSAFIDFVLAQYIDQGVDELDQEKLAPLLKLKYRALPDAFAELGRPEDVRRVFVGFQRHLYQFHRGA